jgi:3-oxoacyl-[acyl-carrier-protein] synthase II
MTERPALAGVRVAPGRYPRPPGTGVALVGWSLYLPGLELAAVLPEVAGAHPDRAGLRAYPPEQAREVLGRKGLLNKLPATRLALCAVHRALGHPPGRARGGAAPDPDIAVVASSNFGNVAAVADIVAAVRTGGRRAVSPVAAPNASSNVLASAVASWFGFGGPNVMLCSGATAGLDALAVGALLLRAGRADRVVVVGAEPADDVATGLHGHRTAGPGAPLRAGAACVVLARAGTARDTSVLGPVRTCATAPQAGTGPRTGDTPPADGVPSPADGTAMAALADTLVIGPAPGIDLTTRCGELYGTLGVAQAAVAAAIGRPARLICGDDVDGWRIADVHPAVSCPAPAGAG